MRIQLGLLLILAVVVGCDSITGASETVQTMAIKTEPAETEHWTHHHGDRVDLAIIVPNGWETYNTDDGIGLNEYFDAGAWGMKLHGFVIHIFVQYLDNFTLPDSDDVNMAWAILKQVVTNPDYVGSAIVSEPEAFIWDQYQAAYYLLNNRDGTVTMLLALSLQDRSDLVVCHISAPEEQSQQIRQRLPELLGSLTINDHHVDPSSLNSLPDPLDFPENPGQTSS